MKKLTDFIQQFWLIIVISVGIGVIGYGLLFGAIGTLPGGYAATEAKSLAISNNLSTITQQPVNTPYTVLVWIGSKATNHNIIVTRIVAALFAIGVAVLFYWVVMHWYSKRIAIIATALFVCSSGYLHAARYGTALILQMATICLLAVPWLYKRAKGERAVTYLIAVVLAITAYVPGMLWFQLLGLIILRKPIFSLFRRLGRKHTALIISLYVALLVPIIWASIHNFDSLLLILGVPSTIPSISDIANNALDLIKSIAFRGYYSPEYWLYGAPLLNVAEVIFFIAGCILLFKRPMANANYWLLAALAVSILLVVLGGNVAIFILVPLVYLVIAAGVYYLLNQWLSVFPRNPIARATGVIIIGMIVVFSIYYHLRAYYIAWPRAPETEHVYVIKQ